MSLKETLIPRIVGVGAKVRRLGRMVIRLLRPVIREQPTLLAKIVALDMVSASSRIATVLLIAAAIGQFNSKSAIDIFGFHFNVALSLKSIFLFGLAIGVATFAAATASFSSTRLSRRLGRWMNEKAMNDLYWIFNKSPSEVSKAIFVVEGGGNAIITQLPIHTGLATETISRTIYPFFLILFSGLVLLYHQPLFTISALFLSILFIPVLFSRSGIIHNNAESFYSATALSLGIGVGSLVVNSTGQHGLIEKKYDNIAKYRFVESFLNSFDTNQLGNEVIGLIVSLVDALVRPVLFVILCSFVYLGIFTIQETIGFLGSIAYLLASSRNIASLLTNLVRYHPQVRRYFRFLDSGVTTLVDEPDNVSKLPTKLLVEAKNSDSLEQAVQVNVGEIVLFKSEIPLSTLSLGALLPRLLGGSANQNEVLSRIKFVSGSFRFAQVPVMEQLCASHRTPEREDRARMLCEKLGAAACFGDLSNGYETMMNEQVWNALDAASRAAIRLVPLCVDKSPIVAIVDVGTIQSLGEKLLPHLREAFSESYLFLLVLDGATCPDYVADHYMTISSGKLPEVGNRSWFRQSVATSIATGGTVSTENLVVITDTEITETVLGF